MKKYLLFDLDGTLTDPKVGICTCVQYALASLGIEETDLDKLEPFIGPPLKDSFIRFYHLTEEQADAAVAKYRERFSDVGLFENEIYKGVAPMLRSLRAAGLVLAVASSKPTVYVQRILEHFGIAGYFRAVVGSELDGRRVNKDEVVQEALRQLFGDEKVKKDQVYMIGDRSFDVEGAHRVGVESVGVTYGYGGMEELKEAKSDYIVRSVEELKDFLLRGTDDIQAKSGLRKIWPLLFAFLVFFLVRSVAMDLAQMLFLLIGGADVLVVYSDAGEPVGMTGNGAAILSAIGFIAGAAALFRSARRMIASTAKDMWLTHLTEEPKKNFFLMEAAAVCLAVGMNLLLELAGVTGASADYTAVAESQYAASLFVGLICYGVVSPVAEELLFRGILYGYLRRLLKPLAAIGVSAALFGLYHGNPVQGVYAFVMGCLIAYGYEYFGDFRMAVAVHMSANILVYSLGYAGFAAAGAVGALICALCLACAAGVLYLLHRQRRV